MQREIKFRAWDKENKAYIIESCAIFGNRVMVQRGSHLVDIPNAIPVQYTGLKDKNGKEIYEGDVLQGTYEGWGTVTGEVVWVDCSFEVSMKAKHPDFVHFWDLEDDNWEVIGNIYQHGYLLDK